MGAGPCQNGTRDGAEQISLVVLGDAQRNTNQIHKVHLYTFEHIINTCSRVTVGIKEKSSTPLENMPRVRCQTAMQRNAHPIYNAKSFRKEAGITLWREQNFGHNAGAGGDNHA